MEPKITTKEADVFGFAPIKQPGSDNYDLFREHYEKSGNITGMVDISPTSANVKAAVDLFLQDDSRSVEIGERALGNDNERNAAELGKIVEQNRSSGVGGKQGGYNDAEAYFLLTMIGGPAKGAIIGQLREGVNQSTERSNPDIAGASIGKDPLAKTARLISAREGELVGDLTSKEAWGEMSRIMRSPEYEKARTEELGYKPGHHPDKEVQEYLNAYQDWLKEGPIPNSPRPVQPEDYENRLKAPSIHKNAGVVGDGAGFSSVGTQSRVSAMMCSLRGGAGRSEAEGPTVEGDKALKPLARPMVCSTVGPERGYAANLGRGGSDRSLAV